MKGGNLTSNNIKGVGKVFFERRHSRASNNASSLSRMSKQISEQGVFNSPHNQRSRGSSTKLNIPMYHKESSNSTAVSSNQLPMISKPKKAVQSRPSETNQRYLIPSDLNDNNNFKPTHNKFNISTFKNHGKDSRKLLAEKIKTADYAIPTETLLQLKCKKNPHTGITLQPLEERREQKNLEQVVIELLENQNRDDSSIRSSYSSIDKAYTRLGNLDSEITHAQNKAKSPVKNVSAQKRLNFLEGHTIKEEHRSRMVDWMIQVYRVLKINNPQTFFMSVDLMDRFFEAQQHQKVSLDKSDLHLIGLVTILISSKYEDVFPIRMCQILKDAGHNKFSQQQILDCEREVLQSLQFKIQTQNIYEESAIILNKVLYECKKAGELKQSDKDFFLSFHLFVSQLVLHDYELILEPQDHLCPAIAYVAFKYIIKFYQKKLSIKKMEIRKESDHQVYSNQEQGSLKNKQLEKNINLLTGIVSLLRSCLRYFKVHFVRYQDYEKQIKCLKSKIIESFLNFKTKNFKNLEKNFPIFLEEESQALLSSSSQR